MHNQEEFIQLVKDNEGIIFKITKAYAVDLEDQQDLYQEIVYQLWKSIGSFRNESKISTWLYRIALNTSITHYKKEKKKGDRVPIDFIPHRVMDNDVIMEERINLVYAHIKRLNEIEKGIILLHLEGNSYDEIALITGFTSSNVGTRLSRIKEKLKAQINTQTK